ncbi:MAG: hypothetical protein KAI47_00335, partial [Deltaproteobacteria bacterium]|nr:hypothetical protein [Deltaproteobacteria bacterium]
MRRRRPGSNPKQGGLAPLLVAAIPVAAILVAAIAGAQPNSAIATPTRVPASRPSNRATTKKSPPRASKRAAPRSIDLDEIVVTGTQETNKDDATTLHRKKLEPHDAQSVADVLA